MFVLKSGIGVIMFRHSAQAGRSSSNIEKLKRDQGGLITLICLLEYVVR